MEIEHAFRSFNPPDETLSLLLTHWSWPGRGSVVKDILPGKTTGKAGNNKALGTSINGRTCDWNHVLNWGICADVECSISRASPCKPLYQNTVNEVGLSGRFCPRQPLFSVTLFAILIIFALSFPWMSLNPYSISTGLYFSLFLKQLRCYFHNFFLSSKTTNEAWTSWLGASIWCFHTSHQ